MASVRPNPDQKCDICGKTRVGHRWTIYIRKFSNGSCPGLPHGNYFTAQGWVPKEKRGYEVKEVEYA